MKDPLARTLSAIALAVALLALVLAGYQTHQSHQSEADLRAIGRELRDQLAPTIPLQGPPPQLDLEEY